MNQLIMNRIKRKNSPVVKEIKTRGDRCDMIQYQWHIALSLTYQKTFKSKKKRWSLHIIQVLTSGG